MNAVFIPFQKEDYTSSAVERVMLRATSIMFRVLRVCGGNFENKTIAIFGSMARHELPSKGDAAPDSARTVEKFL